ncbi:CPBP family intramembrane metalloprotease [Plantibacter sp. RU18]
MAPRIEADPEEGVVSHGAINRQLFPSVEADRIDAWRSFAAVTDDATITSRTRGQLARKRLIVALAGFAIAAVLAASMRAGVRVPEPFDALGGYLLVWIPLLAAVVVARFALRPPPGEPTVLGFAFRPIDLLWGLTAGLILRILVSVLEVLVTGSAPAMANGPAPSGSVVIVASFVIAVLAAILFAPLVEELFFRGLLLRSVQGSVPGRAAWVTVLVSAALFAALHLVVANGPTEALIAGVGTFLVGLGTGTAAVLTGRLGPAIVTHVVFNASLLVLGVTAVTGGTGVMIE